MDVDTSIAQGRLGSDFPLDPDAPFTPAMAGRVGLSRWTIRRLLAEGLVRRHVRRVYVPAHLEDTVELRARSLALVVPPDCVVVDRHAGWLHGDAMVLAPGEHLELRPLSLFRPAGHGRVRNDRTTSGERNFVPADLTTVHGLTVTTPLRTAWDLGRVRWPDEAICGLDAMFRVGGFERQEFLDGMRRFRGMRWVTTLRATGPLADGRSESPGESVLRLRCHESPLPLMTPQVVVLHGNGSVLARLDLANEEHKLAVEYDGHEWHSSPAQQAHDCQRRGALSDLGWTVAAFTATDVFGRHRDVEQHLTRLAQQLKAS